MAFQVLNQSTDGNLIRQLLLWMSDTPSDWFLEELAKDVPPITSMGVVSGDTVIGLIKQFTVSSIGHSGCHVFLVFVQPFRRKKLHTGAGGQEISWGGCTAAGVGEGGNAICTG